MFNTDNPIADFARYDTEAYEWQQRRPKCYVCGEPIQEDYFYDINGFMICQECLDTYHKKEIYT